MARTAVTSLPIIVDPVPGTALPTLRAITLEYSGDDGANWRKAAVFKTNAGRYGAVFPTPENAKAISLKFHATDAEGNTGDLTAITAYHLR